MSIELGNGIGPDSIFEYTLAPSLNVGERGVVISEGYKFVREGNRESVLPNHSGDSSCVRTALLFFERIDAPGTNVFQAPGMTDPSLKFGPPIQRSHMALVDGPFSTKFSKSVVYGTYRELEKREPGGWSMWGRTGETLIPHEVQDPGAGFKLRINNAIRVPTAETPLKDVIEFRDRHRTQFKNAREHLERLGLRVRNSGFDPEVVRIELDALDHSLEQLNKDTRGWNHATDLINIEVSWTGVLKDAVKQIPLASLLHSLPATAAALGIAVLTNVQFKSAAGVKNHKAGHPLQYVATIGGGW